MPHSPRAPVTSGWVSMPPFLYHDNRLSVSFKVGAYYYYYRFPNAPRFNALEEEALRWVWGEV